MKRNSHSKALIWNRLTIGLILVFLTFSVVLAGTRKGDKFLEEGRKS